jgi:hypothetical protein
MLSNIPPTTTRYPTRYSAAVSAYTIANAEQEGGLGDLTVATNLNPYVTNAASGLIIGSQTLSPAAQITVRGEIISLASNGGSLVVFSKGVPVTTEAVGMDLTSWVKSRS